MHIPDAVRTLDRDLRAIFGHRMQSLVAYESAGGHPHAPTPTLAVVASITAPDLRACADHVVAWREAGLATPLVLTAEEFAQSLDVFPFEFGAILARHVVVSGPNPFQGLRVDAEDLRRACEVQTRSHLLHLREGFIETGGRSDAVADLVLRSAKPLAALMSSLARLQNKDAADPLASARHVEQAIAAPAGSLSEVAKLADASNVSSDDARRLFEPYLDALHALTTYLDRWRPA